MLKYDPECLKSHSLDPPRRACCQATCHLYYASIIQFSQPQFSAFCNDNPGLSSFILPIMLLFDYKELVLMFLQYIMVTMLQLLNLPAEFSTNQLHYILFQERTKKGNLTYVFRQQSTDDHTSISASESMILPIDVYN